MTDPSKPHPIDVLYDSFNRQVSIRFRRKLRSHVAVPDTALGVGLPSHENVVLSLQDALRLGQQLVNLVNRVERWAPLWTRLQGDAMTEKWPCWRVISWQQLRQHGDIRRDPSRLIARLFRQPSCLNQS